MGGYNEWSEEKKLDFLTKELKGKRPLVPTHIKVPNNEYMERSLLYYSISSS